MIRSCYSVRATEGETVYIFDRIKSRVSRQNHTLINPPVDREEPEEALVRCRTWMSKAWVLRDNPKALAALERPPAQSFNDFPDKNQYIKACNLYWGVRLQAVLEDNRREIRILRTTDGKDREALIKVLAAVHKIRAPHVRIQQIFKEAGLSIDKLAANLADDFQQNFSELQGPDSLAKRLILRESAAEAQALTGVRLMPPR